MPGPRPKPTALKDLAGNPGKRATPKAEPKAVGNLADPPAHFTDEQRDAWAYALSHAPRGVLKRIDRGVLAAWVVAEDLHRQATEGQKTAGGVVVTTKNGNSVQSPYLAIINRQALIMAKLADHLGFSPAARPRLVAAGHPENSANGDDADDGDTEAPIDDLDSFLASNPSRQRAH